MNSIDLVHAESFVESDESRYATAQHTLTARRERRSRLSLPANGRYYTTVRQWVDYDGRLQHDLAQPSLLADSSEERKDLPGRAGVLIDEQQGAAVRLRQPRAPVAFRRETCGATLTQRSVRQRRRLFRKHSGNVHR